MKKTLIAAALVAASGFAQADFYTIDSFNSGDQFISLNGTNTNAYRTLATTLLASANPVSSTVEVSYGALTITNGSAEDSKVNASWILPSLTSIIPTGSTSLSFLLSVIESDGNPTSLAFKLNGTSLATFAIAPNTLNQDVAFSVSAAALAAGGTLELEINGNPGWDLQLDALGLNYTPPVITQVPEPASLALFAAGLIGLGAARRRKA